MRWGAWCGWLRKPLKKPLVRPHKRPRILEPQSVPPQSIRTADAKAQDEIRKSSAEGRAQIQKIVKDQKGQLEAYSRRTSEQGDVLLGDAQKLLVKANAMAASQLQAEERIRQEFDGFKDTIIGLVSKSLGK